jgi:hypothetical protein
MSLPAERSSARKCLFVQKVTRFGQAEAVT